ncbi:MAG: nicotinate-nucleotide adenylyltransferase [Verrucomicrobiota bacterium]
MMKIALFGGTFDPVHHGHLILAREAVEQLQLDRVIFIPNTISPHKQARLTAPPELRMEMVRAAIAGEAEFDSDDLELRRGGQSYAIDTVEEMRRRYPDANLVYLIGEDNAAELHTWRRFEELQRLVQFVVLSRTGHERQHPFPVVERDVDISSTEIRKRVAKRASIRYLVPEKVLSIIEKHNLYKETDLSLLKN